MKIQYALVRVTQETEYTGCSCHDQSFEMVREQEITRKATEHEVEAWLEGALIASKEVINAERDYRRADSALDRQNRNYRGKQDPILTRTSVEALRLEHATLLDGYQKVYGYNLVYEEDEYRIVKIYSA